METVDQRASLVARPQRGLVTRRQLLDVASVSASTIGRRLASGHWSEPLPGVIDLGSHQKSSRRELQGLLLAAGPSSWVSHDSAAHLHGFLDIPEPRSPDVLVVRGGHTWVGGVHLHTTKAIEPDEVATRRGLRCTAPARTLLDIASGTAVDQLEHLAADLARKDLKTLKHLGVLLHRYRFTSGRRRLLTVLSRLPEEVARLASPLEVLGVAAMRRAGAPPPKLQYRVLDAGGSVIKRVDAAWPDAWTVLEFDGAAYHDTSAARGHDEEVRARMRALGWTVEVLRRHDLDGPRPAEIAARLRLISEV